MRPNIREETIRELKRRANAVLGFEPKSMTVEDSIQTVISELDEMKESERDSMAKGEWYD